MCVIQNKKKERISFFQRNKEKMERNCITIEKMLQIDRQKEREVNEQERGDDENKIEGVRVKESGVVIKDERERGKRVKEEKTHREGASY